MANLPESSTFDAGVYQLELNDPVQGGVDGVDNKPLRNLTNRTRYLYDQLTALQQGAGSYAPLASPALTGSPTAPTPASGDSSTRVGTTGFTANAIFGSSTVNVAGSANVVLTPDQYWRGTIVLTGALTGAINVIFPTAPGKWTVVNQTSGAFGLTCKTAGGGGRAVTQGYARGLATISGGDMLFVESDYADLWPTLAGKVAKSGDTVSGPMTGPRWIGKAPNAVLLDMWDTSAASGSQRWGFRGDGLGDLLLSQLGDDGSVLGNAVHVGRDGTLYLDGPGPPKTANDGRVARMDTVKAIGQRTNAHLEYGATGQMPIAIAGASVWAVAAGITLTLPDVTQVESNAIVDFFAYQPFTLNGAGAQVIGGAAANYSGIGLGLAQSLRIQADPVNGLWRMLSAPSAGRLQTLPGYPASIGSTPSFDVVWPAGAYERVLVTGKGITGYPLYVTAYRDGAGTWNSLPNGGSYFATASDGAVTVVGATLNYGFVFGLGSSGSSVTTNNGGLSGLRITPQSGNFTIPTLTASGG